MYLRCAFAKRWLYSCEVKTCAQKFAVLTLQITLAVLGWALAAAQSSPARQQASPSPSQQDTRDSAPKDYAGMYNFLREGEFVQLTVEDDGRLIGLISRYLNEDPNATDENGGTFTDQMFKSSKLEGNHLSFVTEEVDGIAYEFRGEIERGDGKSRSEEGFYVLKGTLTETRTNEAKKTSSSSREVVLKSFPRDLGSSKDKSK
jgi:hypothetical protein